MEKYLARWVFKNRLCIC